MKDENPQEKEKLGSNTYDLIAKIIDKLKDFEQGGHYKELVDEIRNRADEVEKKEKEKRSRGHYITVVIALLLGILLGSQKEYISKFFNENIEIIALSIVGALVFLGTIYSLRKWIFKKIFYVYVDKIIDVGIPAKKSIQSLMYFNVKGFMFYSVDSLVKLVSYISQSNFNRLILYASFSLVGIFFTITQIYLFEAQNDMFNKQNKMLNKQMVAEDIKWFEEQRHLILTGLKKEVDNRENDRFLHVYDYVDLGLTIDSLRVAGNFPYKKSQASLNGIVLDYSIIENFNSLDGFLLDKISAKGIEMQQSSFSNIHIYHSDFSANNSKYSYFENVSLDSTKVQSTDFSLTFFNSCSFVDFNFKDDAKNAYPRNKRWFQDAVFHNCAGIDEQMKEHFIRMGALFGSEVVQKRINELSKSPNSNEKNRIDMLSDIRDAMQQ